MWNNRSTRLNGHNQKFKQKNTTINKSRSTQDTQTSFISNTQKNLAMGSIKPSSSSVTSSNNHKHKEIDEPRLFKFSSRRNNRNRNKNRSKNISSSPSLEIRKKNKYPSRNRRRQKPRKIKSLPLNTPSNAIVKNSPQSSSIQLPSPTSSSPQRSRSRKKVIRKVRKKPPSLFVYLIRLLILGIGIGGIIGTFLSIFDSNHNILTGEPLPEEVSSENIEEKILIPPILETEIAPLKTQLISLSDKYPDLSAGIFMVDLDNQRYLDSNGGVSFSAASTIKIPILMAFFEDVDQGKISLDETLQMTTDVIGGGSGNMQYQPIGKTFTALETATNMIVISDNTATNMIIKRLGGKELLNERFRKWGLSATAINNYLPDLEGTNTTSPRDLGNILGLINQGDILSLKSRDRVLGIMRQTKTRTLLPQGLGKDAIISHKTGDIGTVLGDAGIIDMPSGKRYIVAVLVKRPHNDIRGRTFIQEISRGIYDYLVQYPKETIPTSSEEVN